MPVPEGVRVVECPYCQVRALVQGERGIRRWQVINRVERQRVHGVHRVRVVPVGLRLEVFDLDGVGKTEELLLDDRSVARRSPSANPIFCDWVNRSTWAIVVSPIPRRGSLMIRFSETSSAGLTTALR